MPIGNVADKVSQSTLDKMNKKDNKPSAEPGFEDGMDFSDLFDTIEEDFGSEDGTGSTATFPTDSFTQGGAGGANSFAPSGNTFGGMNLNGGFDLGVNTPQPAAPPEPKKPDILDLAAQASTEAAKASAHIVKDLVKSVVLRNFDDFAAYSAALTYTGGILAGIGLVVGLIGTLGDIRFLSFSSFPFSIFLSGGVVASGGIFGIGASALGLLSKEEPTEKLNELPDIPIEKDVLDNFEFEADEELWESEEEYADMMDTMFASIDSNKDSDSSGGNNSGGLDDDDGMLSASDFQFLGNKADEFEVASNNGEVPDLLSTVPETVAALNRKTLYELFKPFFPTNTPGFSDRTDVDRDSDEFIGIRATMFEALAAAAKQDIDELETEVESVVSTFFCYEIRALRIKGLNKLDDIKREVEAYFRDDSDDMSVVATVNIERNCYKIILTKGVKSIVTFGDCLALPEVDKFMRSESNLLPFIAGIDDYGQPILADAKNYTTMLIAGKQRSGKSWYVNSIIMSLMAFNSPEDIQFLIIDPKESTLFATIACMPHVCGLHTDKNIINIFQDVINKEGSRRKKLMKENRSENIWDLRKRRGVKVPILFIVIDEFMTVMGNLSPNGMEREFVELMNVVITQLPSAGIHLLFVPHRAQGVVDKTTRAMMMFSAAVRADSEIVKETLDVKKWDRALTQPGDTALKMSDVGVTKYVRSVAITTDDSDNMLLIENMSKAYYRIGVDIPNMRTIGVGYNRNEKEIMKALGIGSSDSKFVKYGEDGLIDDNSLLGHRAGFTGDEQVPEGRVAPKRDVVDRYGAPLHNSITDWLDSDSDEFGSGAVDKDVEHVDAEDSKMNFGADDFDFGDDIPDELLNDVDISDLTK